MRAFTALASFAGCVAASESPNYAAMWSQFKAEFGKTYESNDNGNEEDSRFKIFKANVDKIDKHNAKNLSYRLGVNEFADMTADEFAAKYIGGYRRELRQENRTAQKFEHFTVGEALEDAVDWVAKGGVTPVKNQGVCGSCWSFSTTGAIEGAYFATSGKLISLSEEDLVQCDTVADEGCHGGLMDHAFDWVKDNGGICSEDDYPYTSGGGVRGQCRTPACQPVVTITGHEDVPEGNEDALKAAVAKQPVSIAIEADKTAFQLYKGGVFDSTACGQELDHGVLLVGYGTDGKDFWKVKNSWGPSWGEQGYIRLARGKNMCGIASAASYPTGAAAAGPSPAPGPSPPSPPSPPTGKTHYADPKGGCLPDEMAVEVQSIQGAFCSPDCTNTACPTDMPAGVTAAPLCALNDPVHHMKRCALVCSSDSQCGKGACRHPHNGPGICTYDEGVGGLRVDLFADRVTEIVV